MVTPSRPDSADGLKGLSSPTQAPAVEIKGSMFTLTVLRLLRADLYAIEHELKQRLARGSRFFEFAPVVIDLHAVKDNPSKFGFRKLTELLRQLHLVPVGVCHGSADQMAEAAKAGLAVMKGTSMQDLPSDADSSNTPPPRRAAQDPGEEAARIPSKDTPAVSVNNKLVYDPVRSGQQIYAREGDLILLSPVNAGAEIIADGNIHCYAPLRGRALAGVKGDTSARIFCQCMEAELVAIAGNYQIFAEEWPEKVYRKAVQIYLEEERLYIVPLTQ